MIRRWLAPALICLLAFGAFEWKIQHKMVDFHVYRTAAERALHAEELYRESDQHWQFKYLPAFAITTLPFAWLSEDAAKVVWFGITVGALVLLLRWSAQFVPARRREISVLVGLTTVVMAKYFIHEIQLGQVNVVFTLLAVAGIGALQSEIPIAAGVLFAAAVIVKPYAILFGPWLLVSEPRRATLAFAVTFALSLIVPAVIYGLRGDVLLHWHWWQTVTSTTAPNLLLQDNVSFASAWAKWIGPGKPASLLAIVSGIASLGLVADMWRRRDGINEPAYLEVAALLVLMPVLSPQGWDYVLLLSAPAIMLLADRELELTMPWRVAVWASAGSMGLVLFDVVGRTIYHAFMVSSIVTISAVTLVVALRQVRRLGLA